MAVENVVIDAAANEGVQVLFKAGIRDPGRAQPLEHLGAVDHPGVGVLRRFRIAKGGLRQLDHPVTYPASEAGRHPHPERHVGDVGAGQRRVEDVGHMHLDLRHPEDPVGNVGDQKPTQDLADVEVEDRLQDAHHQAEDQRQPDQRRDSARPRQEGDGLEDIAVV